MKPSGSMCKDSVRGCCRNARGTYAQPHSLEVRVDFLSPVHGMCAKQRAIRLLDSFDTGLAEIWATYGDHYRIVRLTDAERGNVPRCVEAA